MKSRKQLQEEIKSLRKKENILIRKVRVIQREHKQVQRKRAIKEKSLGKKPSIKEQKIIITRNRLRNQVVLNYVDRKQARTGLVYVSIRAITINPDYEKPALVDAIQEAKLELEQKSGVKLSNYDSYYYGLESSPIPDNEDRQLNDQKIHIELFYNGKVMDTYTTK